MRAILMELYSNLCSVKRDIFFWIFEYLLEKFNNIFQILTKQNTYLSSWYIYTYKPHYNYSGHKLPLLSHNPKGLAFKKFQTISPAIFSFKLK